MNTTADLIARGNRKYMIENLNWRRTGAYWHKSRPLHHAGISTDGKYAFLAEEQDTAYFVIELTINHIVWQKKPEEKSPKLNDWIKDGHIEIDVEGEKRKFRIIGLEHHYPLEVDEYFNIGIKINDVDDEIALVELDDQQEFSWLPFERSAKEEHIFATFSDDGSTIMAFAKHAITLFTFEKEKPHDIVEAISKKFTPKKLESHWSKVGQIHAFFEYPQNAGLSKDGRYFLLIDSDENTYLVWDIRKSEIVTSGQFVANPDWSDVYNSPELSDQVENGYITLDINSVKNQFRVFGIIYQENGLHINQKLNIKLELWPEKSQLFIKDMNDNTVKQTLHYRPTSDWDFVSFSDDGDTIAVFVSHDVTFFGYVE